MTTNPDETLESRLRLAALNVEPDRRASSRVKERLMSNFVKRPSVWRSPLVLVLGVLGVSAVAYAGVRTVVIPLLNNSLLASSGSSGTPVVAEPLPAGMSTNVSKRERPNVVHAWKVTMPDGSTKLVTPPTVTLPDGTVVPNTPDR